MNKQALDKMIANFEQRKKLQKIEVSQKSTLELLSYLKELKSKTEALQALQEALNDTQCLSAELTTAIKKETVEEIKKYITGYNSFVYAYIPKEPLLEFLAQLESLKEEGEKEQCQNT